MRIAIASGKGGTGKTTVAVNLAAFLADNGFPVTVADCDVEEPNAHIFLQPDWQTKREETLPVPDVTPSRCLGDACRRCVEACRYKALAMMGGQLMIFPEMCHGCGLCYELCGPSALYVSARVLGEIHTGPSRAEVDITLVGGLMRVGEAMSPPLIRAVKAEASDGLLQILDCPPGTSCPVIEALQGADAAVLVTESTPFGLHDLRLAVETVRGMGIPCGVVINRDGMGDDRVDTYCAEEKLPILGRIPHSLEAASACSEGQLLYHALPATRAQWSALWQNIRRLAA
ncbi:MAG: P-loop NTPase [Desulfovibrionaceae bacterium]